MATPKNRSDPRHSIAWRDLVSMTAFERAKELVLPLPWLALSLMCYERGWLHPGAGAATSFYFFLTGLRISHGAQHRHLGVSRMSHDLILATLSVLMLAPMHAVRWTHLHHHRHCLDEDDVESVTARMPAWRAILTGPAFPLLLTRTAWRRGDASTRRWIAAEILLAIVAVVLVLGWSPWVALKWHVLAMAVGESLCGFFAVWTVHHGCSDTHPFGRTQRHRLINALSFNMFFHAEHHLFPAVPTCHLNELARRIDAASPSLTRMRVIGPSDRDRRETCRVSRTGVPR